MKRRASPQCDRIGANGEKTEVGESAADRRNDEETTARKDIGQVENRREQCPHDEADLNSEGKPGNLAYRKIPDALELRRNRRGGEPETESEQLP